MDAYVIRMCVVLRRFAGAKQNIEHTMNSYQSDPVVLNDRTASKAQGGIVQIHNSGLARRLDSTIDGKHFREFVKCFALFGGTEINYTYNLKRLSYLT